MEPGASIGVPVDHVLLDGAGADLALTARGGRAAKHGARLLLVDGERLPRKLRKRLARAAEELGASLALDPQRCGFPEAVAVQEGFVGGGALVVALDPAAGALGGLGSLPLRVSPPEAEALLHERKLTLAVPPVWPVLVEGRERRWCGPFEVALELHERLAAEAPPAGTVFELTGSWIDALRVHDRMALCAHLARLGRLALVPPDEATRVFLAARHRGAGAALPAAAPDPPPAPRLVLDAADAPLALLHEPYPGTRTVLQRSDTGPGVSDVVLAGDLVELRRATEVLRERPLRAGMLLTVVPSDRRSLLHALEEGLIGTLLRAGAQLMPPGQLPAPVRRGELRVVTRPTGAGDLLCGPALAAVAAVTGAPADPEHMRRAQPRKPPPS